jgi:hypothetical protein
MTSSWQSNSKQKASRQLINSVDLADRPLMTAGQLATTRGRALWLFATHIPLTAMRLVIPTRIDMSMSIKTDRAECQASRCAGPEIAPDGASQ